MISYCKAEFWELYSALPPEIRRTADRAYALWCQNAYHPGLQFKKLHGQKEEIWEARIGLHYRAFCTKEGDDFVWFWIGSHEEANGLY